MEAKLNSNRFTKELTKALEKYDEVVSVVVEPVIRSSSDIYLGLKVQCRDFSVIPVFNVATLYDDYQNGATLSDICTKVFNGIIKSQAVQVPELTWDSVKDKVCLKLQNKRVLQKVSDLVAIPFKKDMVVTFVILVETDSEGYKTIPIKQEVLGKIGVDEFTLYKTAKENVVSGELSPVVQAMNQLLLEFAASDDFDPEEFGMDEDELQALPADSNMFVVSNKQGVFGANQIFNTTLLMQLAEQLDSDLAILPSSINEIIVIPVPFRAALEGLSEIVQDINRTMVVEAEQLSDYALFFDRKTQKVE